MLKPYIFFFLAFLPVALFSHPHTRSHPGQLTAKASEGDKQADKTLLTNFCAAVRDKKPDQVLKFIQGGEAPYSNLEGGIWKIYGTQYSTPKKFADAITSQFFGNFSLSTINSDKYLWLSSQDSINGDITTKDGVSQFNATKNVSNSLLVTFELLSVE